MSFRSPCLAPRLLFFVITLPGNQTMKNAENSDSPSFNGFGPTLTKMTMLSAGWPATLTKLSAGFPRPFAEPPTYSRVNRAVIFFVALKLVSFSLSYLFTARNGPVFILGPCQVLVVQSFAFSFRLSKVRSLIEWLQRSLCNQRGNPMLRILNSFSFWGDMDVLLQSDSVVQYYVVFFPRYGWQGLFCNLRCRTIVKVSLDGLCTFPVGPFSASVSLGSTFFVVQKVRAWRSHIQGLR